MSSKWLTFTNRKICKTEHLWTRDKNCLLSFYHGRLLIWGGAKHRYFWLLIFFLRILYYSKFDVGACFTWKTSVSLRDTVLLHTFCRTNYMRNSYWTIRWLIFKMKYHHLTCDSFGWLFFLFKSSHRTGNIEECLKCCQIAKRIQNRFKNHVATVKIVSNVNKWKWKWALACTYTRAHRWLKQMNKKWNE